MNTKIRKQFVELVKFANLQNLLNTIHWIIFGYICFILKMCRRSSECGL